MALPDYVKRAKNTYNSKFDLIQLKLPKGTKDRIKRIIGEDGSMAAFCVDAILETIDGYEAVERYVDDGPMENAPERPKEPRKEAHEESANETLEGTDKPQEPRQAVSIEELQAVVNRKRQEQEERKEKMEQGRKERKEAEKEQKRAELRGIVEKMRDGAKQAREDQEMIDAVLSDPAILANVTDPERRKEAIDYFGESVYNAILDADKERRREETKQRERIQETEADQEQLPEFMDGLDITVPLNFMLDKI